MSEGPRIRLAGVEVHAGERRRIDVPVAKPYGQAQVFLPVVVTCGREPGPGLFVSAAVHGDELNGVEIIRRLLRTRRVRSLRGALITVPIVNVYGFLNQSRYLPDRRDLNRSFPGSPTGSLSSRLAHVFMTEIVRNSTHGIDLHTGSYHRDNLPQIRACLDYEETERLAHAFGAPVILHSTLRDGSLREAVTEHEIPMLLYEGGEALRFDELVIRGGVRGVLNVMEAIGMLAPQPKPVASAESVGARSTGWVRAPESGVLRTRARLGARVEPGQVLALISDPLGSNEVSVVAKDAGILIGRTNLPLVNEGDALFHIAAFDRPRTAASRVEAFQAELDPDLQDPPSGEPPIV